MSLWCDRISIRRIKSSWGRVSHHLSSHHRLKRRERKTLFSQICFSDQKLIFVYPLSFYQFCKLNPWLDILYFSHSRMWFKCTLLPIRHVFAITSATFLSHFVLTPALHMIWGNFRLSLWRNFSWIYSISTRNDDDESWSRINVFLPFLWDYACITISSNILTREAIIWDTLNQIQACVWLPCRID